MPLDPTISLQAGQGVTPLNIPGALQAGAQAASVAAQVPGEQAESQVLQNQAAALNWMHQNGENFKNPDGTFNWANMTNAMAASGFGQQALGMREHILQNQQTQQTLSINSNQIKNMEINQIISRINAMPPSMRASMWTTITSQIKNNPNYVPIPGLPTNYDPNWVSVNQVAATQQAGAQAASTQEESARQNMENYMTQFKTYNSDIQVFANALSAVRNAPPGVFLHKALEPGEFSAVEGAYQQVMGGALPDTLIASQAAGVLNQAMQRAMQLAGNARTNAMTEQKATGVALPPGGFGTTPAPSAPTNKPNTPSAAPTTGVPNAAQTGQLLEQYGSNLSSTPTTGVNAGTIKMVLPNGKFISVPNVPAQVNKAKTVYGAKAVGG